MGTFSFTRNDRLLEAGDYKRVFDHVEKRVSHRHLLLLATPNSLSHHRLGLVIAKKHVRLAVQRNRIKRQARESFRHWMAESEGLDIVLLARNSLDQLDNAALSTILRQQWQKLTDR
jgi:ribonuclease P protein component